MHLLFIVPTQGLSVIYKPCYNYSFFLTMNSGIYVMFLMLMLTMMDSAPVGPVEQYFDDYGKTAEAVDYDFKELDFKNDEEDNYRDNIINFWWE